MGRLPGLALPGLASRCAALTALSHGEKLLGKLMIYLLKQALCHTLVLSQMKSPMFSKCSKPFLLPFFLPLKMCCSQSLSPQTWSTFAEKLAGLLQTDVQVVPCVRGFDFSHKQMVLVHG